MKKLLTRTFLYLFIILLLPYAFFTWQAKQGVDTFLILHPFDGDFSYQWLWIDLEGNISLQDIAFYQDSNDPIFTAKKIVIQLTSPFDLLDAKNHITHQEYPLHIVINLIDGQTNQTGKVFSMFGVDYQPDHLNYFYPKQCLEAIDKELPFLHFDLSSSFEISRTADVSLVNFSFNSQEFANFTGKFTLNNFTGQESNSVFLSGLRLDFSDLVWIQHNTQKCLQVLNLNRQKFDLLFAQFVKESASDNHLLLANDVTDAFIDFVFIPQKIHLEFNLQEGKTFSQIPVLPIYEYLEITGLSIKLNDRNLPSIFQAYDYISAAQQDAAGKTIENPYLVERLPVVDIHLKLNRRALMPYLGAKIEIQLYNNKVIVGYLEMANNQSIKISQLKYKGKTILPFAFKDIKSILLLRPAR